ncbi:alpha/beta fold hydrolase [Legionella yabuuchiae]|uniref:alpha/beta fold hydrolase n=1 Tax=Legionella yabuuchiae TaxID=376727 RepID=UPI0010563E99|nr:alpha/beta fold hydrolase [Legionella yabuuchiae]
MNIKIQSYGEGEPLVLFHGWGFDSRVWELLTSSLITSGYQLYLVDLPGFGKTPLSDWAYFKTQLLAKLPPRFALIGWSMGGLYATRLAIEVPLRITHLVNVASSPKFVKEENWPGIEKDLFDKFYLNLGQTPSQTLIEFVDLQARGENKQTLQALISDPTSEGLKNGLDCLVQWDLRNSLNSITIPVCYLFGRLDAITPYKTKVAMEKKYPKFTYETFRKSAHMPFLSQKSDFVRLLKEFIV